MIKTLLLLSLLALLANSFGPKTEDQVLKCKCNLTQPLPVSTGIKTDTLTKTNSRSTLTRTI